MSPLLHDCSLPFRWPKADSELRQMTRAQVRISAIRAFAGQPRTEGGATGGVGAALERHPEWLDALVPRVADEDAQVIAVLAVSQA